MPHHPSTPDYACPQPKGIVSASVVPISRVHTALLLSMIIMYSEIAKLVLPSDALCGAARLRGALLVAT